MFEQKFKNTNPPKQSAETEHFGRKIYRLRIGHRIDIKKSDPMEDKTNFDIPEILKSNLRDLSQIQRHF